MARQALRCTLLVAAQVELESSVDSQPLKMLEVLLRQVVVWKARFVVFVLLVDPVDGADVKQLVIFAAKSVIDFQAMPTWPLSSSADAVSAVNIACFVATPAAEVALAVEPSSSAVELAAQVPASFDGRLAELLLGASAECLDSANLHGAAAVVTELLLLTDRAATSEIVAEIIQRCSFVQLAKCSSSSSAESTAAKAGRC